MFSQLRLISSGHWPYYGLDLVDTLIDETGYTRNTDGGQYHAHDYACDKVHANRAVTFAYREQVKPGTSLDIVGTVKGFDNRISRLNRVRVLEQEAVAWTLL